MTELHPAAVHAFGEKLRLTAAALGCDSRKALAIAFRRARPDTAFDLSRSYKWCQGRALPRARGVYEEWAALLGLDRPADWLLACGVEELTDLLAARHGSSPAALRARAGLGAAAAGAPGPARDADPLCGDYACYSHAQSPYYRGRVIRGALTLRAGSRRGEGMVGTYSQALPGGPVRGSGAVQDAGQTLCMQLGGFGPGIAPVFLSLFRPNPPASLLAGMMVGAAAYSAGLQPPYATRFLALRVPAAAAAALEASNRYLEEAEWPPGRDLGALGLAAHAGRDAGLEGWLAGAAAGRLEPAEYIGLAAACDRAWLGARRGEAAAPPPG